MLHLSRLSFPLTSLAVTSAGNPFISPHYLSPQQVTFPSHPSPQQVTFTLTSLALALAESFLLTLMSVTSADNPTYLQSISSVKKAVSQDLTVPFSLQVRE
jgi:hypothetical protein